MGPRDLIKDKRDLQRDLIKDKRDLPKDKVSTWGLLRIFVSTFSTAPRVITGRVMTSPDKYSGKVSALVYLPL